VIEKYNKLIKGNKGELRKSFVLSFAHGAPVMSLNPDSIDLSGNVSEKFQKLGGTNLKDF
jgi:hypothetical protein